MSHRQPKLSPVGRTRFLIRTFHQLLEEEKCRSVIWDEECLDFAILKNRYDHKAYNATLQPAAKQSKHFSMLLTRERDATARPTARPDCTPTGRAVGFRHPRAVGAGVWMWGPNTVPSACMPCGGCVPRGWRGAGPGGGGLPPL